MKPAEFIAKFGWDLAQRDVTCLETGFITKADFLEHYGFEILDEIKIYIDAWELVKEHYMIDRAKKYANSPYTAPEIVEPLKKAIALVDEVESLKEVC